MQVDTVHILACTLNAPHSFHACLGFIETFISRNLTCVRVHTASGSAALDLTYGNISHMYFTARDLVIRPEGRITNTNVAIS